MTMKPGTFPLILFAACASQAIVRAADPLTVTLTTPQGTIGIQLYGGPDSVAGQAMARANSGFRAFYRVVPGMAVQGRIANVRPQDVNAIMQGPGRNLPFDRAGLVAVSEGAFGNLEFSIMLSAAPHLNGKHAVIGEVITGMPVVRQIAEGHAALRTGLLVRRVGIQEIEVKGLPQPPELAKAPPPPPAAPIVPAPPPPPQVFPSDWFPAVAKGDVAAVTRMLGLGADVNMRAEGSWGNQDIRGDECALDLAARKGNVDMARLLVEHGARVNGDEQGSYAIYRPLQTAAEYGNREVAEFLVARGAKKNVSTMMGVSYREYEIAWANGLMPQLAQVTAEVKKYMDDCSRAQKVLSRMDEGMQEMAVSVAWTPLLQGPESTYASQLTAHTQGVARQFARMGGEAQSLIAPLVADANRRLLRAIELAVGFTNARQGQARLVMEHMAEAEIVSGILSAHVFGPGARGFMARLNGNAAAREAFCDSWASRAVR